MTLDEYQARLKLCWFIAQTADSEDLGDHLDKMLVDICSAETIVPMINPTLWIQKHGAMGEDKMIVEAVIHIRNVIRTLKKDMHEKAKRDR